MRYLQDKLMANIKAGDSSTANAENWDPSAWRNHAKGVGTWSAP